MIITKLIGGLGNQLFQYAAGRCLAEMHNVDIKIDTSHFETYELHNYSLHHFNISAKEATKNEIEYYSSLSKRLQDMVFCTPYYMRRLFKEQFFHFDKNFRKSPADTMLSGYWQSEKYFLEIKNILKDEFSIITPISNQTKEIASELSELNSISLHIRRGDYISDSKTSKEHGTCDESYYRNCVKQIVSKVNNPVFYIFSDDPDWVKSNFKLDYPIVYVTHNDETKNYEDLYLMSLCKHNIIANSSFSWWGAWLNSNLGRNVFAPKKWFNHSKRSDKDIIPDSWIRV